MNEEIESILIGQAGDIEKNSVEYFEHEEIDYAIYHLESGFYATQGMCTCENNVLLSEGTIENEEIECFSCGEIFNITTGEPINDPDNNHLKIYEVYKEGEDLYLKL